LQQLLGSWRDALIRERRGQRTATARQVGFLEEEEDTDEEEAGADAPGDFEGTLCMRLAYLKWLGYGTITVLKLNA
jgi:hypothetical protein